MSEWIVDLGPDGGVGGGKVVFEGTPEALACETDNHTGHYLALEFEAMQKVAGEKRGATKRADAASDVSKTN